MLVPRKLMVGVECGPHMEYPVVTVFNLEDRPDWNLSQAKEWEKRIPEQVHGIAHHERKRHIAEIDYRFLGTSNLTMAKEVMLEIMTSRCEL